MLFVDVDNVAVFESVHASCEERLEMASFSVLIRIS